MTSLLDILQREDKAVRNLEQAKRDVLHDTSLAETAACPKSIFLKWKQESIEQRQRAFAEWVLVRQELRQYLAELNANEDDIYL